jgi:hypothetical protein
MYDNNIYNIIIIDIYIACLNHAFKYIKIIFMEFQMKKLFGLLLAVMFSLTLASCGDEEKKASSAKLVFVNNSTYTINSLYVSLSTSTTWGSSVLGSSTIAPGASFTISGVAPGTYDLMISTAASNLDPETNGHAWVADSEVYVAGYQYTYPLSAENMSFTKEPSIETESQGDVEFSAESGLGFAKQK